MALEDISQSERSRLPVFGRWFWLSLLFMVLIGFAIRLPRMSLSLYNDEVAGFQSFIEGKYESDSPNEFREATWADTAWRNHTVNNHALYSLLARLCYTVKKGDTPGQVFEVPLRVPSLVGGLLSMVAIAILAVLITGRPRAGIFAALFLAIHPWHVRYSTEARGYGLLFSFEALLLLFAVLALRQPGRWRWWIGFALVQTACLWTYLGAVYLLMGVNVVLVFLLFFPFKRSDRVRSSNRPCWIVATIFSAALYVGVMAPALAQTRVALAGAHPTMALGAGVNWWVDVLCYFVSGRAWIDETQGGPVSRIFWLGELAVMFLAIRGIVFICRRMEWKCPLLLVAAPIFSIVMPWVVSVLTGSVLLNWYVNTAVIFLALWMGIGLEAIVFGRGAVADVKHRLLTFGLILAVAVPMMGTLQTYRHFSKQQLRAAVKITRLGETFPFSEKAAKALVAGWWTNANVYDPAMRIVDSGDLLAEIMQEARENKRELYFILGERDTAMAEDPSVVTTLEDPTVFEKLAQLPGLEQTKFQTLVFKLVSQ